MRFDQQIVGYQTKHERRRRWYKIVSALACIVVFCTTYALILPALTMETPRVLECPLVVHEHTADCYDAEGGLICGQADFVVHTHDEDCYDEDGNLVCTLPEIEAHEHSGDCYTEEAVLICEERETAGHQHDADCYLEEPAERTVEPHTHTDACYMETHVLVCGEQESEGHRHDEGCYTMEQGALLCGRAEHAHDESCYDELGELLCTRETHEHTNACYEQTAVLACGMEEGEGAHVHDSGCYDTASFLICELAEDEDASGGDEPERTLICELEEGEGAHIHDADCYETETVLSCGKEEVFLHEHTDDCYEEVYGENGELISRVLVCGRLEVLEHVHTDACFRVIEMPEIIVPNSTYTYEDSAVSVEVTLAEGTTVPADAALRVQPITSSDETYDYDALVQWAKDSVEGEAAGIALYDISFYTAEEEYIPVADTATVSIRFKEPVLPEGGTVTVLHYEEDETTPVMLDAVDVEQDENEALSALTFQTEGFSVFAVVTLAEDGAGDTAADYNGDWAIVNLKNESSGVAMMAGGVGGDESKNRAGKTVTVYESEGVYYVADSSVTIWHFAKQEDGTYYISTTVGDAPKYLTIAANFDAPATLSDNPQSITIGAANGKVQLNTVDGGRLNLFGGDASRGFGSYYDDSVNTLQTLCKVTDAGSGTLVYDINVPSMSDKGTGWQTTPSLDSTVQSIGETGGKLFAQPNGYTTDAGTAGIANLYRFNIADPDHLLNEKFYTDFNDFNWYGEERFDGWTYTVDGTTYLFAPETAVTKDENGNMTAVARKKITTNKNNEETIETIGEATVTLPAGAVLTGHWTEVSNVVTFFVNYKGTILDTEGDVSGRREDTFTKAVAVGHLFYGKLTVGKDHVFGAAANEKITAAFTNQFDANNPNPQIVIRYLRKCKKESTTGTDYETSVEVKAIGANSKMIEENTLKLLKETGRTVQIATGSSNPTIDNSLCDSDHYEIRWYVMKEQADTWHIDGVLVAKTAEIAVTKTFSGLTTDQAKDLLKNFSIQTDLGVPDKTQPYLNLTTTSVEGQYEYAGSDATASLPNSYHWTLHAITDETYTMTEENYQLAGYDVSSIIVHYYDHPLQGSQIVYGYGNSTGNNKNLTYPVTGGQTTAVSFNNFYTPTDTGAMAIVKRDSTTSSSDLHGILPDAVFALYKDESCTVGKEYQSVTTNANGTAYFSGMGIGTYYLKETKAPKGYTASDKVFKVVVTKSDDKVTVTLYEPDSTGGYSTQGTVLYDGGIQNSYTVKNTAKNNTVTVSKTFSGLTQTEMNTLVSKSMAVESGVPSGYYISLKGDGADADNRSAVLTLDQAQRSGDGYTFTWTIHDLEVVTEDAPVKYTIAEHNYTILDASGALKYVDVAITAKMTNPKLDNGEMMDIPEVKDADNPGVNEAFLHIDRSKGTATIYQAIFSDSRSDVLELTNHYTNTFELKLKKVDSKTNQPLKGAEFKIYGPFNESTDTNERYTYTDANGTKHTVYYIETITSNANGFATLSGLTLSNGVNKFVYILDESKAPRGYTAAQPQVVTVTVDKNAISTPAGSNYTAGVLEYDAPNTKEEDYVHTRLDTKKVWNNYTPEGAKVTLELYRVTHNERGKPLDEVENAVLVASVELDGTVDDEPTATADTENQLIVTAYESSPWVATWMNLYSASMDYSDEKPEHYHYFVREVTEINGFVTSYTCLDKNGKKPDGAIQKLKVGDKTFEAVLIADMDEAYTATITNTAHFELPQTGGTGAIPYAIGGTLLMAGSLLYGYRLRRRKERRSAR